MKKQNSLIVFAFGLGIIIGGIVGTSPGVIAGIVFIVLAVIYENFPQSKPES